MNLGLTGLALAQQQQKLTRFIVGFPPGGGVDIAARGLTDRMRDAYPGGLIVESRPGASARLAADYVKASPPDGSTILFTTDFVMTVYPHSFKKLTYDPIRDFAPVAVCTVGAIAFCIGPGVPAEVKTVADFVSWARANPDKAAFASTSAGGTPHFAGIMFSKAASLPLTHVPYKGGAPALQDLMGGQIASSFNPVGELLPQLKSGRIRPLAVITPERSRFLPDVPTMVESGYKDVSATVWLGAFMPAGTPREIVAKASSTINQTLKSPELKATYAQSAYDTIESTPESFAELIKADIARWGPIVKASGFTADE